MTEKSYVGMEAKVCPICGVQHTYDCALFIDKRLKNSLEKETVTGFGLCEEHQKLYEDGYLALVGMDEEKSTKEANGNYKPQGAYRTGSIVHVKRHVIKAMIDIEIAEDVPLIYVEEEVIDMFKTRMAIEQSEIKDEEV